MPKPGSSLSGGETVRPLHPVHTGGGPSNVVLVTVDVLDQLHAEVHERVERCQLGLHLSDQERPVFQLEYIESSIRPLSPCGLNTVPLCPVIGIV